MIGESECYWTALRYTKLWQSSTTPVLEDVKGRQAVALEDKKMMAGKVTFSYPSADLVGPQQHYCAEAHPKVDEATIK